MLLVIDAGNTNIVLGIYKGSNLLEHWRIETDIEKTSDEYGILITELIRSGDIDLDVINESIISSVVPPVTPTLEDTVKKYLNSTPIIVGPGTKTGISISVDNPKEVGADRIVNAVAAHVKYGGDLIIVDFGTATTFDYVSAKGEYLGGVIAPGVHISAEALFTHASKLPKVEITRVHQAIGKNTIDNMQSGLYFGYIGLTKEIVSRMKTEIGRPTKVIATGGLSFLFEKDLDCIDKVDPMLTLEGLRLIYERNNKGTVET
jgi:type III pantothenate kinase